MQLYISQTTQPEEVKTLFSSCYPFLKIELYKIGTTGSLAVGNGNNPVLDTFPRLPPEAVIDIRGDITVAELERSFAGFGVRTEIFRKSGNVWVATLLTHNWTLQQQNSAGEEITNHR